MLPQYPLTERVEEALRKAQQVAREYAHEYVSTEHLLLGLLAQPSGEIPELLRSHGIEPDVIPTLLAQTLRRGKVPEGAARIRPYSSRARWALQTAADEAAALGHEAVDLLHLMLALRTDTRAIAAQVIIDVGIPTEALRKAMEHSLPDKCPPR